MTKDDIRILRLALQAVTHELDDFIIACVDENGQPKKPAMGSLMKAKACLPEGHKNAFAKKVKR